MKAPLVVSLSLLLGACGAQPYSAPTVVAVTPGEEPKVICTREKPTGSNRRVKVCRPAADAVDRENTRRDMQVLQRQSEIINAPPD